MATLRETISRHTKIVGLRWKRLENKSSDNTEDASADSPVTRSMSRREALRESQNVFVEETGSGSGKGFLRRARSVRDAFGSIRQVRVINYCYVRHLFTSCILITARRWEKGVLFLLVVYGAMSIGYADFNQ